MFKKLLLASALTLTTVSADAQLLYKIEGNNLQQPSYIFGTHHLSPLSITDSIADFKVAFESSPQVVGEIDMTVNPMTLQMKMQPYMVAPEDSTLSVVIPADKYAEVDEVFRKYAPMPGLTLAMFDAMKPMVVQSTISVGIVASQLEGYNQGEQLDTYFQTEGAKAGKKILGLETPEQQAQLLFSTYPILTQVDNLIELIENPEKMIEISRQLNDSYASQDLSALYNLSVETDDNSEMMMKLLDERNADWLTRLPAIISETPSFIAVGALHLPGEKGILQGLRNLGYTVTPLK